jgi:hypothetical protein
METRFEVTGVSETLKVFEDLRDQVGDAKKSSKILVKTVAEAMKPVLAMAKGLVHKDTGLLDRSLSIVARRPTNKDMKSKYVLPSDSAIALVTTKPIPKKLKLAAHLAASGSGKKYKSTKKGYLEGQGYFYDARAVANEFGTSKMAAKPYLRISLESQQQQVSNLLSNLLKINIEKFRSNNINTKGK